MVENLIDILVWTLIVIISALPLHLAVKMLGGRTHILKTILVMFASAILTGIIAIFLPFGTFIAFLVLIWVYHEMFRIKWIKALLVWILQIIFIFILGIILSLVGISLFMFNFLF